MSEMWQEFPWQGAALFIATIIVAIARAKLKAPKGEHYVTKERLESFVKEEKLVTADQMEVRVIKAQDELRKEDRENRKAIWEAIRDLERGQ